MCTHTQAWLHTHSVTPGREGLWCGGSNFGTAGLPAQGPGARPWLQPLRLPQRPLAPSSRPRACPAPPAGRPDEQPCPEHPCAAVCADGTVMRRGGQCVRLRGPLPSPGARRSADWEGAGHVPFACDERVCVGFLSPREHGLQLSDGHWPGRRRGSLFTGGTRGQAGLPVPPPPRLAAEPAGGLGVTPQRDPADRAVPHLCGPAPWPPAACPTPAITTIYFSKCFFLLLSRRLLPASPPSTFTVDVGGGR